MLTSFTGFYPVSVVKKIRSNPAEPDDKENPFWGKRWHDLLSAAAITRLWFDVDSFVRSSVYLFINFFDENEQKKKNQSINKTGRALTSRPFLFFSPWTRKQQQQPQQQQQQPKKKQNKRISGPARDAFPWPLRNESSARNLLIEFWVGCLLFSCCCLEKYLDLFFSRFLLKLSSPIVA